MADGAAVRLLRAAGGLAPRPVGGKQTGVGMAVFVRVAGMPDALCVELPPDATVADLHREAQAQAGERRVGGLSYAGELLTDGSVALADAGIGPQAVVDAGATVQLTFVEEMRDVSGFTFGRPMYAFMTVPELEGLRLTGQAPPHTLPSGRGRGRPLVWIEAAPTSAGAAGRIRPGMVLRGLEVRVTGPDKIAQAAGGRRIDVAVSSPEAVHAELQRLQADRAVSVRCRAELNLEQRPPALTGAVPPGTTLAEALRQVAAQHGYELGKEERCFKLWSGSMRRQLNAAMSCGDINAPVGALIVWTPVHWGRPRR
eukprot:TRINITY_DN17955_c0_g1_i2.p1 TRINITY_DN17955_c0_g1~~TRINITY_DN17955_c0_g1_i2.p1  ORF type:complete len:313 (+),score=34.61 TRINITY_DN17955_c0_g1_i2:65-1003(+)